MNVREFGFGGIGLPQLAIGIQVVVQKPRILSKWYHLYLYQSVR